MNDDGPIRALRERLVAARRDNDRQAVAGLVDSLQSLAVTGYRCCLVDFDACRPHFYVRVVGYEDARVTAELEFPIEPRLRPVQRVPLSHLVEYGEAEPTRIRKIYESMAPFLHHRRLPLQAQPLHTPPPQAPPSPARRRRVEPVRRTDATDAWWAVAALLLLTSLAMFAIA